MPSPTQPSRGEVMDRGLWRYTRHPTTSATARCGGASTPVASAGGAWWTVIGPLMTTILLVRVSGVARLERTIAERRPGYAQYAARTSAFIPLPPAMRAVRIGRP